MLLLLSSFLLAQWINITPDASFKNWTRAPIPPTAPLAQATQWKVEKGVVTCTGKGGHEWLRYEREFGDFVLSAEWRFIPQPGEPRYNSGIFVRNSADASIWHQAQTGKAGGYLFGMTLVNGKPERINLQPEMKENRVKPVGEWNRYVITCKGQTISLQVNGATVSEYRKTEVPKGYVGLEAEGFPIEFRKIRIRPL
ncbi:MAG: DUF1080 domain-containing protein [Bryobacteraceae bacterium]